MAKKGETIKKNFHKMPDGKVMAGETHKELYKPFVSKMKNKKYSVYVKNEKTGKPKLIHFGDNRYQQYRDVLGHYKNLDHGDKARRAQYYARHGPETNKNTAKYWSHKILWPKS